MRAGAQRMLLRGKSHQSRQWPLPPTCPPRNGAPSLSRCRVHWTRSPLSRRHAGFTSPGWRPSAAISAEERALTTLHSPASAKCLAASMASPARATAALKYLSDGASGRVGPIHAARRVADCAGMIIWTTQPAGGALLNMVRTCAHLTELVQFCPDDPRPPTASIERTGAWGLGSVSVFSEVPVRLRHVRLKQTPQGEPSVLEVLKLTEIHECRVGRQSARFKLCGALVECLHLFFTGLD